MFALEGVRVTVYIVRSEGDAYMRVRVSLHCEE